MINDCSQKTTINLHCSVLQYLLTMNMLYHNSYVGCCICACLTPRVLPPQQPWTVSLCPQGTVCSDCVFACFCGPCTWCQIAREIKTRMNPITFVNTAAWWEQAFLTTSPLLTRTSPLSSWTYGLLFTGVSAVMVFGVREGFFDWFEICFKHVCVWGMSPSSWWPISLQLTSTER